MKCPSCGEQLPERGRECPACQADVGWWVRRPDGTTFGPYDLATVHLCISGNRVGPGDLARVGAGAQWAPVEGLLPEAFEHPDAPLLPEPKTFPPPAPTPPAPPQAERTNPWLVSGIVALVLVLACAGILAAVLLPTLGRGREKARQAACQSNLKQISLALLMYAQDNNEHFPPAGDWQVTFYPYIKNQQILVCPSVPGEQGYAYNHRLDGLALSKVRQPAMLGASWDAGAGPAGVWPPPGATANRHNAGDNFGFADGHVTWFVGRAVPQSVQTTP